MSGADRRRRASEAVQLRWRVYAFTVLIVSMLGGCECRRSTHAGHRVIWGAVEATAFEDSDIELHIDCDGLRAVLSSRPNEPIWEYDSLVGAIRALGQRTSLHDLYVLHEHKTVCLDPSTGRVVRAIDHPDELHARFSISQDGVYAVDEEGGLWRLDTAPPSCVYESPRRASHGCIDAKVDVDAGVFVSMRTGLEGNAVEVVALSDLRERRVFGLEPGGRGRIDVGDNALVVVSGTVLHAWRLDDGSRLCEVEVGGGIAALAVSRDAHWIACGKYGSDVLLFKLPEGKLAQGYRQLYPERDAASLHFSPDAKWVYAGFWYAAAGYAPSPRVLVLEVPPQ